MLLLAKILIVFVIYLIEGDSFIIIKDWIPTQNLIMLFASNGSVQGFIVIDIATAIDSQEIKTGTGKNYLNLKISHWTYISRQLVSYS